MREGGGSSKIRGIRGGKEGGRETYTAVPVPYASPLPISNGDRRGGQGEAMKEEREEGRICHDV